MEHNIPLCGKWETFTDADLNRLRKMGREEEADTLMAHTLEYDKNRLAYFLPHGRKWTDKETILADGAVTIPPSCYKKECNNDGIAFLNDRNDMALLIAPNQTGKSYQGAAWSLFRLIPADPRWPCFQDHGIEHIPWTGPKILVAASYSWDNVTTLWKRYRELCPRQELGVYAPQWGKYDGEVGAAKNLTFGDGRPKRLKLACGSEIIFLCYTQQQMHWESFECDLGHFDEQPPKEKWVGWNRGTTTRGDYTPCCFTLTGHIMDDRPDTGAAGWVKRELWDATATKGKSIGRYCISVESVPDTIISRKKKKALYDQWVNPKIKRTEKDDRAAVARYWGGWEEGSGLYFDEFDRSRHIINPLWDDDKVPRDWTKYRVIDYGGKGVTCCLWFAISPQQFIVCYRELYDTGFLITESTKTIIEMSHNEQMDVGMTVDDRTGAMYRVYREHIPKGGEEYFSTVLDGRSCAQEQQGQTLADIFECNGLEVQPACGQKNEIQIPRLRELLNIDFSRNHISRKDGTGEPSKGAPRLYFFDGKTDMVIQEIELLQRDPEDPTKISKKQASHAIDCLKYFASEDPQYWGDQYHLEEKTEEKQGDSTPYTNY